MSSSTPIDSPPEPPNFDADCFLKRVDADWSQALGPVLLIPVPWYERDKCAFYSGDQRDPDWVGIQPMTNGLLSIATGGSQHGAVCHTQERDGSVSLVLTPDRAIALARHIIIEALKMKDGS